jgi:hypothetical protein
MRNGAKEAALDLLEKYLTSGRNVTSAQKQRWSDWLWPTNNISVASSVDEHNISV